MSNPKELRIQENYFILGEEERESVQVQRKYTSNTELNPVLKKQKSSTS
jgi:hypothetical protein